jgi:hypothetical protein
MKLEEFKEKYKEEPHFQDVLEYLIKNGYETKEIMFNFTQAKLKEELWIKSLNGKESTSQGLVSNILLLQNGFSIVQLKNQESRNYEGKLMRHCVSTYTDESEIYSLRDKDNIPHCTLEMKDNFICQIKGVGNGTVSPKYVQYVLEFLDFKNADIEPFEMENLGYFQLDSYFKDFINQNFKGGKFIIDQHDRSFIYTQNKLELIKSFTNKEKSIPWTFLEYFCSFGQSSLFVKQILKATEVPQMYLDKWLQKACEYKQLEIVKLLLKKGADVGTESEMPLFYASANGHLNIVKYLMSKGADPIINNASTLLVSLNQPHVFKYYYKSKKINWNQAIQFEKGGFGLIACAITIGASDSLNYLIKKGIKPADADLALAGEYCDLKTFKKIVKAHGNISEKLKKSLGKLLIKEYRKREFAEWLEFYK